MLWCCVFRMYVEEGTQHTGHTKYGYDMYQVIHFHYEYGRKQYT